jgi:hypothetical protein
MPPEGIAIQDNAILECSVYRDCIVITLSIAQERHENQHGPGILHASWMSPGHIAPYLLSRRRAAKLCSSSTHTPPALAHRSLADTRRPDAKRLPR